MSHRVVCCCFGTVIEHCWWLCFILLDYKHFHPEHVHGLPNEVCKLCVLHSYHYPLRKGYVVGQCKESVNLVRLHNCIACDHSFLTHQNFMSLPGCLLEKWTKVLASTVLDTRWLVCASNQSLKWVCHYLQKWSWK